MGEAQVNILHEKILYQDTLTPKKKVYLHLFSQLCS